MCHEIHQIVTTQFAGRCWRVVCSKRGVLWDQSRRIVRFDVGLLYGRVRYSAIWHCGRHPGWGECAYRGRSGKWPTEYRWMGADGGVRLPALFTFNATGVVVGDISVVQTFAGQTLAAVGGSFSSGGPGDFSFGIGCTTCGNGNLGITSNLDFTIANATIADVTAPNNLGYLFVADVFSSQTGNTGRVATLAYPARSSVQACRVW